MVLHCHYTGDTQYRVWFDLDNSLTRWRRTFLKFSKICNLRNSQNSVSKTIFSLASYTNNFLVLHCHYTGDTQYGVCLIWATPWPDEKQLFLKFSKIRDSRNSQNSVWKPIFFLGKLYQQLFGFTLSLHWWYSIPSLVWFGHFLDPMKKNIFKILKNSQFAKFAKFRMNPHFFPRQALPTNFGFTLSLHWWHSIPSLVWFGQLLDPMKKNIFKILKNLQFAKFAKFRIKNHFFLGKLYQQLLAVHCHYTSDTQYRVSFDLQLFLKFSTPWPDEKQLFLKFSKIRNSRNSQNSVWKPIFFLGKLYQQLLGFTLSLHWWYSIRSLFDLGNSLTRWRRTIFKILKNSQFAKFAKFRMKTHFFS